MPIWGNVEGGARVVKLGPRVVRAVFVCEHRRWIRGGSRRSRLRARAVRERRSCYRREHESPLSEPPHDEFDSDSSSGMSPSSFSPISDPPHEESDADSNSGMSPQSCSTSDA